MTHTQLSSKGCGECIRRQAIGKRGQAIGKQLLKAGRAGCEELKGCGLSHGEFARNELAENSRPRSMSLENLQLS